jgi:YD repeat-containing protein
MTFGRVAVGHPVDVASGAVYTMREDARIDGRIPLILERRYSTALLKHPQSVLGPGWVLPMFATLRRDAAGWAFRTTTGVIELFEDPEGRVERGEVVRHLGSFLELQRIAERFVVTNWDSGSGLVRRYVFPGGHLGDAWGPERVEDAAGQGLLYRYDGEGRVSSVEQRLEGRALAFGYDGAGRLTSVSGVGTAGVRMPLVTYEYDGQGRLHAAFDALGQADRYEYDAAGRITRELLRDGGAFSFQYDDTGRCVRTVGLDGYDAKTLRYRDAVRWTEVTDSLGRVRRFEWLPTGQVVREMDARGGVTETRYDEHLRIVEVVDPVGASVKLEYDNVGNRVAITNPLGSRAAFKFDARRQLVELQHFDGSTWTREYDPEVGCSWSRGLWAHWCNTGGRPTGGFSAT